MNILIGILLLVVFILSFLVFTFVVLPKMTRKYHFLKDVRPGVMADDFLSYIPEQGSADYIEKYGISINRRTQTKFASISFKKDVHQISFFIVCFDVLNHPFDIVKVNLYDAEFDSSHLVRIPVKTAALYIQVTSAGSEKFDDTLPIYIPYKQHVVTSLIYGLLVALSGSALLGGLVLVNLISSSWNNPKFWSIFLSALFVVAAVACYLILTITDKKYMGSEDGE